MGSQARAVDPIDAVLFDLHGTLIDQGTGQAWIDRAMRRLDDTRTVPEGLAGFLERIWENAREFDPQSTRDLDATVHHAVFHKLIADFRLDEEFTEALYASMLEPWAPYQDALPTLRALREAGVRIFVLSNIGVPIDHVLDRTGIGALIDGRVLSYEVGHVKPDAGIFRAALDAMDVDASAVLMVGDSAKDDAGAGFLGIRTLILPRTFGPIHGLDLVRALVMASRS